MKLNWKRVFLTFIFLIAVSALVVYLVFFNKKDNDEKPQNGKNNDIVEEKKLQILDLDSKSRTIAFMINNHKIAQPLQTGLNDAYIIYEIITEGGITRMLALFKDKNINQIGTIRSSRHYFLDYVQENDAIYVHFGWSPQAQSDIKNLGINNVNGIYDEYFWRDNSLNVSTEHTVYTSMEKINNAIASKKYKTTSEKDLLLKYSIDEINLSALEGSKKADKVKIVYSSYQTNEFRYDSENKVYTKYSNNEVRKDRVTGKPFTAKNIITYKVKNHSIDDYGRQDIDNVGTGEGYYISNGYAVPIKWEKSSPSSQTVYKYLDGKEINVNDGNTYIQIQPSNQNLEISEKID